MRGVRSLVAAVVAVLITVPPGTAGSTAMARAVASAVASARLVDEAGTSDEAPTFDDTDTVRGAKLVLARFVVEHVDRPLVVDAPCPTLPVAAVAEWLGEYALVASEPHYAVTIAFDQEVGSGLVAVRCGVDLQRRADPDGSVRVSLDVTMLDGQATFSQLAVAIGGRDVVVSDVTAAEQLAGIAPDAARQMARCTNGGRDCTSAVGVDGLAVIVRLRGLPADGGELIARYLALGITADVIANLTGPTV